MEIVHVHYNRHAFDSCLNAGDRDDLYNHESAVDFD